MEEVWREMASPLMISLVTKIPSIVAAMAVLFGGWILARLVSRLIGKGVQTLVASEPMRGLVDEADRLRVHQAVSSIAYYLLIILVFVLAFDVLGVSAVVSPFVAMAGEFTMAVPNLVKAGLILLTAWVVAGVLRGLILRFTSSQIVSGFLSRAGAVDGEENQRVTGQAVGNLAYYLVFFMFLPAVLGAFALEGLLAPFEQLLAEILTFLPRIMAAALTVLIGYLVARIVQGIVAPFLASAGLDAIPGKMGLERVFQATPVSRVIGTVAFVLILIPTVISGLETLGVTAVSAPAINMLTTALNMVPRAVAATVILAVGIALARWVGRLVTALVVNTNLTRFLVQWGVLRDENAEPAVPVIIGQVVAGVISLAVLIEALDLLRLEVFSQILRDLLRYLPNVVVAVVILVAGWGVGRFTRRSLENVLANTQYPVWLSSVAEAAVMVLASMMALEQLGVARAIVVTAFTILLGSLGLATALAVGLGAKDCVRRWLDKHTT